MTTDERIARLPVWAQDLIRQQTGRIERLERTVREITGQTPTRLRVHDVLVDVGPAPQTHAYLDSRRGVEFDVADRGFVDHETRIRVRLDHVHGLGDVLNVNGGDGLSVFPACSNGFYVGIAGR